MARKRTLIRKKQMMDFCWCPGGQGPGQIYQKFARKTILSTKHIGVWGSGGNGKLRGCVELGAQLFAAALIIWQVNSGTWHLNTIHPLE